MKVFTLLLMSSVSLHSAFSCPQRCTCGYHIGAHPMDCSSQGLTEIITNIPEWTTSMKLDGNELAVFDLNFCEVCTYFVEISLRYNRINKIIAQGNRSDNAGRSSVCGNIPRIFPRLRSLHLRGNALRGLPKCLLFVVPSLRYLNLNENQITSIRLLNFVTYQSHTQSLEELHVKRNSLTQLLKRDLYTSAITLRKLRVLDLSENRIHTIEGGVFTFFDELRDLRLTNNKIGFLSDFTFVTKGQALKTIQLSENRINWISTRAFAGLPNLRILDLRGNKIECLSPDRWSTCQFMTLSTFNSPVIIPVIEELKHFSRFNMEFRFPVRVEISRNPLRCDCRLYNLFNNSNFTQAVSGLKFVTCRTPNEQRDERAIEVIRDLNCNDHGE